MIALIVRTLVNIIILVGLIVVNLEILFRFGNLWYLNLAAVVFAMYVVQKNYNTAMRIAKQYDTLNNIMKWN